MRISADTCARAAVDTMTRNATAAAWKTLMRTGPGNSRANHRARPKRVWRPTRSPFRHCHHQNPTMPTPSSCVTQREPSTFGVQPHSPSGSSTSNVCGEIKQRGFRLSHPSWGGLIVARPDNRWGPIASRSGWHCALQHQPDQLEALGPVSGTVVVVMTIGSGCGELAAHRAFTAATNVKVYFCDRRSPWQRGSRDKPDGPQPSALG